jgi:branched-chain amino acid transport system substrate-binding protein
VNTAIANARELVDDIGVKAIWGTESHDFSIAMTKITNPAKVLQFTGVRGYGDSLLNPFLHRRCNGPSQ